MQKLNGNKCVMVIDEPLPLSIIANTAGIMGLMLGKHIPETISPEVTDKNGCAHLGIIQIPVPVLGADREKIKEIKFGHKSITANYGFRSNTSKSKQESGYQYE